MSTDRVEHKLHHSPDNSATRKLGNEAVNDMMQGSSPSAVANQLKKAEGKCPSSHDTVKDFLPSSDFLQNADGDKKSGSKYPSGRGPAGISESPTTNPATATDTAAPKKGN